ncbi:winged helix-turn-helix domain-containing protein [Actinoplanes sp. NPDC051859]|uniref:winged helix-turn-helix domain-containing protein n=1 Tax=Actinoplanes sp. NPDC051859 TaxID=3363909 RepID=UPI0037A8D989
MLERRPQVTDPAVINALAHPVRLDVLGYLMSGGPATASECARQVGDTPSNCSYHLRVLAAHGLVERDGSGDGRSRPWRATVTGFSVDGNTPDGPGDVAAVMAAAVELDHHLAREYLRRHAEVPPRWRERNAHASYGLALTVDEHAEILQRIDAVVRPYIQAVRTDAPADAEYVHLSLMAIPRPAFGARR